MDVDICAYLQGLPIALDYQQQAREAKSGPATAETAGAAGKPNALETVLLWACDPVRTGRMRFVALQETQSSCIACAGCGSNGICNQDSAPGARLLCKEVAGEAVRSAVSTACVHWKAGREGEAMAAAGRADSGGREEGTHGGEWWRYEEGENPDVLLAEHPSRHGHNGQGFMRPRSGQRFAAAVGHDSSAAAQHEGGGGREARGGDARIERVWPVVVGVAASADCRRLVCEVAAVCVREALRTGWSCLVGCGEEEGSDGARDSKGEDRNGGVVPRGVAGREKGVRGGRMLKGLTAGARMVQWIITCSRGGLRRPCGWSWVVGVGSCTGWGTWLVVSKGWGGALGTEASAAAVAASVCVAVLVAHVLTLCVTWLLSARVTASIAPPPVTSPAPVGLGSWALNRVTYRTEAGAGRQEPVLTGAEAVGGQSGSENATLAAEWAACGYHYPLCGEALGGGRVGVE